MKSLVLGLSIAFMMTLMPGLGGCADRRQKVDETTQPEPLSTQPAEGTSDMTEEEAAPEKERPALTRQADRMVHNAELADMCLADIHFLPNRAVLNSNGTQRLSHLAWLMDQYGGSIKLDLEEPDSPVARERIQTVQNYLRAWGLPESKIQVSLGLAESKGMEATEAIKIHNDTRYKNEKDRQKQEGLSSVTTGEK